MKYERIRYAGTTIYLQEVREVVILGQDCLKGEQVNKQGELTTNKDGAFVNHIVALNLITKRVEVFYNNKYGVLETH